MQAPFFLIAHWSYSCGPWTPLVRGASLFSASWFSLGLGLTGGLPLFHQPLCSSESLCPDYICSQQASQGLERCLAGPRGGCAPAPAARTTRLPLCGACLVSFEARPHRLPAALAAKAQPGKPSSLIPMPSEQDLGKQIDLILASEGTAKLSSSTLMGAADCTGISGL